MLFNIFYCFVIGTCLCLVFPCSCPVPDPTPISIPIHSTTLSLPTPSPSPILPSPLCQRNPYPAPPVLIPKPIQHCYHLPEGCCCDCPCCPQCLRSPPPPCHCCDFCSYPQIDFDNPIWHECETVKSIPISLYLDNPLSTDVTVTVFSADGTATGKKWQIQYHIYIPSNGFTGDDYSSGPYNVTFPANKTSVTFNIQLRDDNVFEKNETFRLIINQHSFSSVERLIVNPFVITFVLNDDDGKYCNY